VSEEYVNVAYVEVAEQIDTVELVNVAHVEVGYRVGTNLFTSYLTVEVAWRYPPPKMGRVLGPAAGQM
jgi:hypothetical protein